MREDLGGREQHKPVPEASACLLHKCRCSALLRHESLEHELQAYSEARSKRRLIKTIANLLIFEEPADPQNQSHQDPISSRLQGPREMDLDEFKHFPSDHQHMPDTVLCARSQMTSKWLLPSGCPQDRAVGRLQVCLCPVACAEGGGPGSVYGLSGGAP